MNSEGTKLSFSHSVVSDSLQPRERQHVSLPCPSPSLSLLMLVSFESVMPSNHLILCCPPLLLPAIFPSIRVFSNELALPIRWPKYWSFSFSISPSNDYPGYSAIHMHISILPQFPSHPDCHTSTEQSSMYYLVGPFWFSILNIAVCTC